jgi:hypothetical protein
MFLCIGFQLLVTANVPRSLIHFTLMMESIRSTEKSVLPKTPQRNIPKGDIVHSYRRENLKSYIGGDYLPMPRRFMSAVKVGFATVNFFLRQMNTEEVGVTPPRRCALGHIRVSLRSP